MNFFRLLFVLLFVGALVLILSDDARRAARQPFDRFREHFYRMRGGQSTQVPMGVSEMANTSGLTIEKAQEQFNAAMANAPRFRFEGTVAEQLPSGHVLVIGHVRTTAGATTSPAVGYALFGHPSSAALQPNTPIRCDVQTAGVHQFARAAGNLVKMQELIYAGEFTPLPKERSRTLLDRP